MLERLHPFLAPAVNPFHEISASDAVSEGVASTLRHMSPGIMVLDWQMRVARTTVAGRRACAEWNQRAVHKGFRLLRGPLSVPGPLLQVCQELSRELSSIMRRDDHAKAQRRRLFPPGVPNRARLASSCARRVDAVHSRTHVARLNIDTALRHQPRRGARQSLFALST